MKKKTTEDYIKQFNEGLKEGVKASYAPTFVPTGMLEPAIIMSGGHSYDIKNNQVVAHKKKERMEIINLQTCNKAGKTTTIVNILKNIFWPNDKKYFDYDHYNNWPYMDGDGTQNKRARIYCTPQNASDAGPIRTEMLKWWPGHGTKWDSTKNSKSYHCIYTTDTGWYIDIITYEQQASELEGPMISLHWCDEPPPAKFIGPIMSRSMKGQLLLLSQTPIAAYFLDAIQDLKEKGTKVGLISGTIDNNSSEDGIKNTRWTDDVPTKRGLMTNQEIVEYSRKIPRDEEAARLRGLDLSKSGKIYWMFNQMFHIRDYDLNSEYCRKSNHYCVMDPHDRKYPAIQWWMITPPDDEGESRHICYNEWPTHDTLKGYYFESLDQTCNYTVEKLCRVIKVQDGTQQFGYKIKQRAMDPRFAKNTMVSFKKDTPSITEAYAEYGLQFTLPTMGYIEEQRNTIRTLLEHDEQQVMHKFNEPKIFIMPHCKNTIRSLSSHYWDPGKDKESETYKDFVDTIRIYFAMMVGKTWEDNDIKKKKAALLKPTQYLDDMTKGMRSIALA